MCAPVFAKYENSALHARAIFGKDADMHAVSASAFVAYMHKVKGVNTL